jgi:hypothetical protein
VDEAQLAAETIPACHVRLRCFGTPFGRTVFLKRRASIGHGSEKLKFDSSFVVFTTENGNSKLVIRIHSIHFSEPGPRMIVRK